MNPIHLNLNVTWIQVPRILYGNGPDARGGVRTDFGQETTTLRLCPRPGRRGARRQTTVGAADESVWRERFESGFRRVLKRHGRKRYQKNFKLGRLESADAWLTGFRWGGP